MNLLSIPKIAKWKETVESSGGSLHSIDARHLVHKKNGDLLFGVFTISGEDSRGNPLLPSLVIRGDATVIVPQIHNRDTGERKFAMIYQPRTGNGQLNLEFPAGMLDLEVDNPERVAIRELEEETGLQISEEALTPLWTKNLYTSVGLQDESIYFYGCCIDVTNRQFISLEGHQPGGDPHEDEIISVTLKTEAQARNEISSVQVLLGLYLFNQVFD